LVLNWTIENERMKVENEKSLLGYFEPRNPSSGLNTRRRGREGFRALPES